MPDEPLLRAAEAGQLKDPDAIRAQAERLLDACERSRTTLRFFFDSLLPISGLASLKRDSALLPKFTPEIGALLREETLQYLEREILDEGASWPEILTQPFSYLNEPLAAFYGIDGVGGAEFSARAAAQSCSGAGWGGRQFVGLCALRAGLTRATTRIDLFKADLAILVVAWVNGLPCVHALRQRLCERRIRGEYADQLSDLTEC